ncbi:hypothetical protein SAMN05880582_101807 [Rhizobium sp. RU20A]|nr:hypothetical protein SAMN05880582_101807 [Rhizobium sp. RU20A]
MRHRRGIDLDPARRPLPIRIVGEAAELAWLTFAKMPSGSAFGARLATDRLRSTQTDDAFSVATVLKWLIRPAKSAVNR